MPKGSETLRTEEYIRSRLAADGPLVAVATGGLWRGFFPEGESPPGVVFRYIDGDDVATNDSNRLMTWGEWIIEGVVEGEGHLSALATMAERIDAAIDARKGDVTSSLYIHAVERRQPWARDDVEEGIPTHRAGGIYRLWVQPV